MGDGILKGGLDLVEGDLLGHDVLKGFFGCHLSVSDDVGVAASFKEAAGIDVWRREQLVLFGIDGHQNGDHAIALEGGSIAHDVCGKTVDVIAIDIDGFSLGVAASSDLMVFEGEHIAVVANEDVVFLKTHIDSDVAMEFEHAVLTMDWHEVLRAHETLHKAEFLAGWVARAMEREGEAILFDVSALFDKVIDESINESAVSWNSVA